MKREIFVSASFFFNALRKVVRFIAIYGPSRALFKVAGRLRISTPRMAITRHRDVGLIGCGQFAIGTIGYFLQRRYGARIAACYDIDIGAATSLARTLHVPIVCDSAIAVVRSPGVELVYVASNHASHASYAVDVLAAGRDVYIEKPIATSLDQLGVLCRAMHKSERRVFAGYNRPFAAAILDLRSLVSIDSGAPITLSCFVSGHKLPVDHWYREPAEGTRVCGNFGHWLDLFVHILAWRSTPDQLEITLTWADDSDREDNICVTVKTSYGDLFSLVFSSRTDPFEGVAEQVSFQHGDVIARIDDFRRLTIWHGPRLVRRRYWPKDVGHARAIMQPFNKGLVRNWDEVERTTLLTLRIAHMVRERTRYANFSFEAAYAALRSQTDALDEGSVK